MIKDAYKGQDPESDYIDLGTSLDSAPFTISKIPKYMLINFPCYICVCFGLILHITFSTMFINFFLFFITFGLSSLTPTVHSSNCIEVQKQLLLNLKQSLSFDSSSSSKLVTWNSSLDCCSWLGVTCSTNGSVITLDLSRESISCNINSSSSLFQLQDLESLNLAYNDFNGSSIPSAIGNLVSLRYLNLTSAYFSGQIPNEVAFLTRLVTLDLSKSGKPLLVENPNFRMLFQNLTEIVELYIYSSVDLSTQGSDWCEAISSLSHLRVLKLSGCGIRGPLCLSLANLDSLFDIDLSYNSINSQVPSNFANLSNLTYLSLTSSMLLGTFPEEVFQIPSLQAIDLSYNDDLLGSFPEFPNNGSLRSIVVDSTSFSGELPVSIGNLKMLSTLSLSHCKFSGSLPSSIENLKQLVDLDIAFNSFNSPISSIHWENLVNIESLYLRNNQLSGTIPSSLFSLPKLKALSLSHNRFSGKVRGFPVTSSSLLEALDLEYNNLEGDMPASIFNLQGLAFMYLSSNNFTSFPFDVFHPRPISLLYVDLSNNNLLFNNNQSSNSSSLQIDTLSLASNKLTTFPEFLKDQTSLGISSLNLSGNHIQGDIPNWIFCLKSLTSLDLSSNLLVTVETPLPNSTSSLASLDLHSNELEDIPSSYSFLQLESLILASNKLTTCPDFLSNQSTLYTLDLSDNQIHGKIPNWIWSTGTSFSQARNLSFNLLDSLEAPNPPNSTYIVLLLDLHANQLQGQIPLFLSGHFMDYSRNNFNSSIPNEIGDFIYARSFLSLASSNLHGAIPNSICNASGLVLILSNNSLSGEIPHCLTEDIPLQSRVESRNKLDQAVLHSVVDLSRNKLNGSIPDNFRQGCRLETLDLSRNQLGGQFPKSLINCSALVALNLGNNIMTDTFPCVLMNISKLGVLVLRSNKFYGSIGCPNTNDTWLVLQVIDLAHNNFNGELAGKMFLKWQGMMSSKKSNTTMLEYPFQSSAYRFDLPDSFYRDAITAIIKGLEFHVVKISNLFTLLDFSSNNFNGSIPEEIGALQSLWVLNLSNNAFSSMIPSSFGQMQQLESLDLSNNQLSGAIPQQMAKLSFLAVLDLSNNELVGRIPTSTQFSTFPKTSFEGNKGLWGPPLTDEDALLPRPPSTESLSPSDSGNEIGWDIISAEIGFTCGFGVAVGSLMFSKRWRKWYYTTMRDVLFKIFPQLEERFGIHRRHVYINTRR